MLYVYKTHEIATIYRATALINRLALILSNSFLQLILNRIVALLLRFHQRGEFECTIDTFIIFHTAKCRSIVQLGDTGLVDRRVSGVVTPDIIIVLNNSGFSGMSGSSSLSPAP